MYGCLCLYRPQLWKATVLFTVKGCDGPSSEKGPLCPSFCVDVCVYMSGVGVGGLYIWSKLWGPNCFAWWNLPHSPHLGLCVCQQLVCECVCGYGITYPMGMFLYKGRNIRKKKSYLFAFLGNLQDKTERQSVTHRNWPVCYSRK